MAKRSPSNRLYLALAFLVGTLTTLSIAVPVVLLSLGYTLTIETNSTLKALWGSSMLVGYGLTLVLSSLALVHGQQARGYCGSQGNCDKGPSSDAGPMATVSSSSSCGGDGGGAC